MSGWYTSTHDGNVVPRLGRSDWAPVGSVYGRNDNMVKLSCGHVFTVDLEQAAGRAFVDKARKAFRAGETLHCPECLGERRERTLVENRQAAQAQTTIPVPQQPPPCGSRHQKASCELPQGHVGWHKRKKERWP